MHRPELLFASLVFLIQLEKAEDKMKNGYCNLSLLTIKEVRTCPTNERDWKKESTAKGCEFIEQLCVPQEDFQYHCLVNNFTGKLLSVCAPVRMIIGKSCAEYNKGGRRIEPLFEKRCGKDCPFLYLSNQSYKYKECYTKSSEETTQSVTTISETKDVSNTDLMHSQSSESTTDPSPTRNDNNTWLSIFPIATLMIGSIIVSVCCFRKKRRERQRPTTDPVNERLS